MFTLRQSTAITVPFFAHDADGNGVTGIADGSWTKRISKNGAVFGAMTVTVSEMENGWYSIPVSTSHSDTLGFLAISLSAAAAKRVNLLFQVSARLLDDLAYPNVSGRGLDVDASGGVEITPNQAVNAAQWAGAATATDDVALATAPTNFAALSITAGGLVDITQAAADKVWSTTTRTLTALGASLVQEIWDRATSALTTAGSIGKLLVDNVNATISSRSSHSAADVWSVGTRTLTAFSFAVDLSTTAIQALWDKATSALTVAGSIGKLLVDNVNAAIDSRAPASTAVSNVDYTAARAAKLDNLDVAVTTRATPAQVNTEVVDALNVDTYAEPGQGNPPATTTLATKINYLFKGWRNRNAQTSSEYRIYADNATTVDQKATVSDDGTTFDRGEIATGP